MLKVAEGPNIGKEYVFEDAATIGRVEGNDIVIVEPGISRNHARVYAEHGVYKVADQGSANGTLLNGTKVKVPEVLREGDHLTVSQTTLQFSSLDPVRGEATRPIEIRDSELLALDAARKEEARGTRRRSLIVGVSVGLLLLGGVIYFMAGGNGPGLGRDRSDDPIAYVEKDLEGVVLGFGDYAKEHQERVMIDFEYLGGRVTVQYGAWGVDKVGELELQLNGQRVAQTPVTLSRWVYGIKTVLPRKLLRRQKTNRIIFNSTRNPPHDDPWEIYDIHILQEAIPPPDKDEAYRQYELAKKAWEERHVEPGNAFRALLHLRQARDRLEGLEKRPGAYADILSFIRRVDGQLTKRFEEGLFSARRLERVTGDIDGARRVLRRTLRYFNKGDYRYRQMKHYLAQLDQIPDEQ